MLGLMMCSEYCAKENIHGELGVLFIEVEGIANASSIGPESLGRVGGDGQVLFSLMPTAETVRR